MRVRYLIVSIGIAVFSSSFFGGCTMLYHDRAKVLIPGVDIDQTLDIAELEIAENKMGSVLTLWAMRDQVITSQQAKRVNDIYFAHIDRIDSEEQKARMFSVWHLTWAISNMYRLGDRSVKSELINAYTDAARRVDNLDSKIATTHFYDDEIVMGDAHIGGRGYARSHIVVPGNEKYVPSLEAYKKENDLD